MKKIKLVRDKIPDIIGAAGKSCTYRVADNIEYQSRLYEKINEELLEFVEDPCVEEAADIFEVFSSICKFHEITMGEVMEAASQKRKDRGSFSKKIILLTND